MNILKNHCLLLICLLGSTVMFAQKTSNMYNVLYKGKNIGTVRVEQTQQNDQMAINVLSNIEMKMLLTIKVDTKEQSVYNGGLLTYSSSFRAVNGKEKLNRQIRYQDNIYQTVTEGKTGTIDLKPINFNLLKLYVQEPSSTPHLYVDNVQKLVPIKSIAPHTYSIEMPNGNANTYYYENGLCTKIDIHSTYCNLEMQLAKN